MSSSAFLNRCALRGATRGRNECLEENLRGHSHTEKSFVLLIPCGVLLNL